MLHRTIDHCLIRAASTACRPDEIVCANAEAVDLANRALTQFLQQHRLSCSWRRPIGADKGFDQTLLPPPRWSRQLARSPARS